MEEELGLIAAEARLRGGAGEAGITAVEDCTGIWWSSARIKYREPVLLLAIDVAAGEEALSRVCSLAARVAEDLEQECVYVTVSPIAVIVLVSESARTRSTGTDSTTWAERAGAGG